jgi:hypothetical protein
MQLKSTQKTNVVFFMQALSMFVLTCFFSLSLFSQQYFNGNLSTGITSSNGVSAPVGYAWSELQTGNEQPGFGAQIANNFTIADNFSVNVASWTVSKVTFFAYSTGYTGATSPFRDLRELLKNNTKHTVKEIYLHSSRLREGKMVDYYEPPLNNYLDIDTDKHTIEESIKLITDYIQ